MGEVPLYCMQSQRSTFTWGLSPEDTPHARVDLSDFTGIDLSDFTQCSGE